MTNPTCSFTAGRGTSRRELMMLLGATITAPRALRAQQKAMPVIGFLGASTPGSQAALVAAFREGLSQTGWAEGQNVTIEYRWAEGHHDRLPPLAADLVERKVDVIAAMGGTPPAVAAKGATSTIPIVFAAATRSSAAWSPISPGQAATSPASAASICPPSGSRCFPSWFPGPS